MKKNLLLFLLSLSSFLSAQISKEDVILKINGDSLRVNIISVDEKISFNWWRKYRKSRY